MPPPHRPINRRRLRSSRSPPRSWRSPRPPKPKKPVSSRPRPTTSTPSRNAPTSTTNSPSDSNGVAWAAYSMPVLYCLHLLLLRRRTQNRYPRHRIPRLIHKPRTRPRRPFSIDHRKSHHIHPLLQRQRLRSILILIHPSSRVHPHRLRAVHAPHRAVI